MNQPWIYRLPIPWPSPGVCSNSCQLSQWPHPTISSSVIPFSSCLQSSLASGSLLMSRLFTSGWLKYWSFSFIISPPNEYSGSISFRIDWLDLIAGLIAKDSQESSPNLSSKASILWCSAFFMVQLSHPYMTARKSIALTIQTFVSKVMSLFFNTCYLSIKGASAF